ncbi:MAG: hypothetical protein GWO24_28580, partial [Akkermansiaceae bacterium]|nr:hypothetical protein [Akkermansiaceae bacterium]
MREAVADKDANQARQEVVASLDELMGTELDAFVDSRSQLINRLGMSGYARLMDRFAAAERQLNRAWSAAADRVLDESVECLVR